MPFDRKEYMKKYGIERRKKDKEKISKQQKEYYEKNKGEKLMKQKEYYEKNKDKVKTYSKTDNAIRTRMKSSWKRYGVKHYNYDELYDYYKSIEKCELCNIDFTESKKCLDHCHRTGYFRCICCNNCNIKRPKIERLHVEVLLELNRYFNLHR